MTHTKTDRLLRFIYLYTHRDLLIYTHPGKNSIFVIYAYSKNFWEHSDKRRIRQEFKTEESLYIELAVHLN